MAALSRRGAKFSGGMFENNTGPLDSGRVEGMLRIELGELSSAVPRCGAPSAMPPLAPVAAVIELVPTLGIKCGFETDTES